MSNTSIIGVIVILGLVIGFLYYSPASNLSGEKKVKTFKPLPGTNPTTIQQSPPKKGLPVLEQPATPVIKPAVKAYSPCVKYLLTKYAQEDGLRNTNPYITAEQVEINFLKEVKTRPDIVNRLDSLCQKEVTNAPDRVYRVLHLRKSKSEDRLKIYKKKK